MQIGRLSIDLLVAGGFFINEENRGEVQSRALSTCRSAPYKPFNTWITRLIIIKFSFLVQKFLNFKASRFFLEVKCKECPHVLSFEMYVIPEG